MNYLLTHPAEVGARLLEHLELTFVSLAIALILAVPAAVYVARANRLGAIVLGILSAIYTVPSLALLAILVPVFGLGRTTAIIALVAYAQMILVRNIAAGLQSIPRSQVDAARGLGMSDRQRLWRVEFPLALPVMLGGVRIALVSLIAIANIAAWVNAGGLGRMMFDGIERDDPNLIVAGAVPSALLAIIADLGLRLIERRAQRHLA